MFDASFDSVPNIDEEGYILTLPAKKKGGTLFIHEIIPQVFGTGDKVEIYEMESMVGTDYAHDSLTFSGAPADTDTVTINFDDSFGVEIQLGVDPSEGGLVFEFDNTGAYTAGRRRVQIGTTAAECAANLAKAILAAQLEGICPVQVWVIGAVVHIRNLVPGSPANFTSETSAAIVGVGVVGGADPPTRCTLVYSGALEQGPLSVDLALNGGVFVRTVDAAANNPQVTVTFKHTGYCPRLTGKGVGGMNSADPSFA